VTSCFGTIRAWNPKTLRSATRSTRGGDPVYRPRVQLAFVQRYCPPQAGWRVFVRLDPDDEGNPSGNGRGDPSRLPSSQRWTDAQDVRASLGELGADIGEDQERWLDDNHLPLIRGGGDILAFHRGDRKFIVARVEERRLSRAVGQLVAASSQPEIVGWRRHLCLVVDDTMDARVQDVSALARLGVSGVALGEQRGRDRWVFGDPP
jgi:hypothetical protein